MQTFTIEEAAALIAKKHGLHEGAQGTLIKQLLDAAKDGTLTVRHPHTDLPYRPKEHCEYYETVSLSDLNRFFEAAGVPWRLDNGVIRRTGYSRRNGGTYTRCWPGSIFAIARWCGKAP
jgi:hypothetical protein